MKRTSFLASINLINIIVGFSFYYSISMTNDWFTICLLSTTIFFTSIGLLIYDFIIVKIEQS